MSERHPGRVRLESREPLDEARRHHLLRHVAQCAACRAVYLQADPSRLFSLLALGEVPPATLERVNEGVTASLDRGAGARRARGLRLVAAVAASGLLATLLLVGGPERRAADPAELARVSPAVPAAAEPGFALLSSPGDAQVVDLALGGVRLVMIYDESLDL